MGLSHKDPRDMNADEFIAGLKPISDDDIYLEVPSDRSITMAAETLDPKSVFIMSPSYKWFPVSEEFQKRALRNSAANWESCHPKASCGEVVHRSEDGDELLRCSAAQAALHVSGWACAKHWPPRRAECCGWSQQV